MKISGEKPDRLVIGADQTLCLEGRLFGKPASRAAARAQLEALSGRTHELYSGCCVAREKTVLFETVGVAKLCCRHLSPAFIEAYMAKSGDAVLGSAGVYQIEGLGIHLFDAIEGDHATILGLPLLAAPKIPARGRKSPFVTSVVQGKPKACVIGWPVAHSRSPLIHRFWLERLKIEGSYELAAVAPPDFPAFVRELARQGFAGANVTLPHKQTAFELCDVTTTTAASLKAVNTLWIEAGKLCGDNTDAAGFVGSLDQDAPGWDINSGNAVVIGAGGAARAIVYALKLRGMNRILLINRTKERAAELASDFGASIEVVDFPDLPGALAGANLLVNTTSLGMRGQPPLAIDLTPLPPDAVVSDIVYVPLETELIRTAQARGLRAVSGIGMLLHQAVPGFERWFGIKPCVTPELRGVVEADIAAAA